MRPKDLAVSILSLLSHDPKIKALMLKKNDVSNIQDALSAVSVLEKLPLLHILMRLCPLPDLDFEALFVEIRRKLLENLVECKESPGLVNFLCTLSQHVFINEYIYNETEEETRYVKALETELSVCAANQEEPALLRILILACYRPLHQYTWCEKIQAFHHLSELKSLLIDEPINDQNARRNVLSLGRASDATSLKVREQYDESPYPRWVKVSIPTRSKSIRQVCEEAQLQISRERSKKSLIQKF